VKTLPRLLVVSLVLLSSCAWSRRDNRPVWNAFEGNLVPESQGAFLATLPLTVPLGLGAILVDTFVAHPLQVVDDAADDAVDLWHDLDWQGEYYTQAGFAPLRAVATPCWFLLSFAGRSMFDLASTEQREQDREDRLAERRQQTLRWLAQLAAGGESSGPWDVPEELDAELRAAVAEAQRRAQPLGRIELYAYSSRYPAVAAAIDWVAALQDPSAVVRFRVLRLLPDAVVVPDHVLRALRNDPDEAVRSVAMRERKKW
jgi:hypothetical protein